MPIYRTLNLTDVRAVNVDADGNPIIEGIGHTM
jgi:hypothetical protein